ncbi:MAG: serine protease [Bdellovibrio sp.]
MKIKNTTAFVLLALSLGACSPSQQESLTAIPDAAVVGGKEISLSSPLAQSTVGIYESKLGYICSGTLIAPNLVLTAAHCVDPRAKNLGIYFASEMKKASPEQIRRVTGFVVHPGYNENVQSNDTADIAMLRFEGEVPAGYQAVPMLFDAKYVTNKTRTYVAGYGLNWTFLAKRGSGTLRAASLEVDEAYFTKTEAMLGQSVFKGICSGDSGGPAYVQINGQLYIWGVASRGDSIPLFIAPKCMLFSIYTRVDAYQSWISETMQSLQN